MTANLSAAPVADSAGKAVTDVGKIFGSAGIDGLILYALLIGSFLLFLALMLTLWLQSRERGRLADAAEKRIAGFTDAALATAEAVKELATAVTSTASSNMTFQQTLGSQLVSATHKLSDCEQRMRDLSSKS